jgi:hypothetical protein
MRPAFYQPSGRIPALTVLAFLCALAGAGAGAFLYALASVPAPGYVNVFLTLVYALWLAFLVHAACYLAKVRNPGFMKLFGLLVGLSGWALHWMCWIVFASYENVRSMPGPSFLMAVADLFAGPGALLQELGAAIEATEWSERKHDFFPRAVCWLFELSILLSLPSQAGASRAGRPFCEATQRWAVVTRLEQRFAVEAVLGARRHLAAHPEQLLKALSPLTSERSDDASVTLYAGKRDSFISVETSKNWFDRRNGQEQGLIVEYLRVPRRALDQFVERLSHPDAGTRQARSKRAAKRSLKKTAKAS